MDFVEPSMLNNNEMVAINVPTFLAKSFLVKSLKKENESKELIQLVKSIKKIKVLTIQNPSEKVNESFRNYKTNHSLDELMKVNNDGDVVKIHANQNDEELKRIILEIKSSTNEIVFVDMKGKFTLNNISKVLSE